MDKQQYISNLKAEIVEIYKRDGYGWGFDELWKEQDLKSKFIAPLCFSAYYVLGIAKEQPILAVMGFAVIVASFIWIWKSLNKTEDVLYLNVRSFTLRWFAQRRIHSDMVTDLKDCLSEMQDADIYTMRRCLRKIDDIVSFYEKCGRSVDGTFVKDL